MTTREELLARWARSQTQLAGWRNTLVREIAAKFAARTADTAGSLAPHDLRHLYDLWTDCAEEAYAAVVRRDEFCRAQAEGINTACDLLTGAVEPSSARDPAGGVGPSWAAGLAGGIEPPPGIGPGALPATPLPHAPRGVAGCSLRDPVWQRDTVVLYRYRPLPFVQAAPVQPVLICFSLVNRPHVLDIRPDHSLIRNLLAAGLEVYLIDWGYPDANDRTISLSDYLERYLAGCVDHVLKSEHVRNLNLIGVCQGGTLSLCYCALHPRQIANLVLIATPVDFHTPENLLTKWARYLDMGLLTRSGNLHGGLLTAMFMALSPFRLMHQKYVALLDQAADGRALELFGRMEQWICDSPDQAATAARQFVQWFYQENRLVRGSLRLHSRPISLRKVGQPVLNIYGTQDHIVPPSATTALRKHLGTRDYTEHALDTGHVGLYVSRRAGQSVPRMICSWLRARS